MAHMLENSPRAAYYVKPAWHNLGVTIPQEEVLAGPAFLERARMAYAVRKVSACYVDLAGHPIHVPNQWHLQRNDDGTIVSPHTVADRYVAVAPSAFVEEVCEPFYRDGWAKYESAFTLMDGTQEVVTMRLDFGEAPQGEEHINYLAVQNFHGIGKLRGIVTRVRVVCANTVALAFAAGENFRIRHTGDIVAKMNNARTTWTAVQDRIREHNALLEKLNIPCNVPNVVAKILKYDPTAKPSTQLTHKFDEICVAAKASPGTNGQTYRDVYNGLTWYTTHSERGSRGESNTIASLLNGSRARFMEQATDKLLALVSA